LIKQFVRRSYDFKDPFDDKRYKDKKLDEIELKELKNKRFITNIYAVERKGEAERIKQWQHLPNRQILWHGTKAGNLISILGLGLMPAPYFA